jgi:hypothetical protein
VLILTGLFIALIIRRLEEEEDEEKKATSVSTHVCICVGVEQNAKQNRFGVVLNPFCKPTSEREKRGQFVPRTGLYRYIDI